MHFQLEVILPPVENLEEALEQILKPFSENGKDEEGDYNRHGFYDYYVIGGRWSGNKILANIKKEDLDKFYSTLTERKITVSGLQFGKQTLSPESQIPMVDQLWNEFFPDSPVKVCPLFGHYKGNIGDVMALKDIPKKDFQVSRVIIAKQYWEDTKKLEAGYMLSDSIWNGVTWQDTKWDGTIKSALEDVEKDLKNAKEEYKNKNMPTPDWLCVTIDYHS